MPTSWEYITPVTPKLKTALDALHPQFIKEAEADGRKVKRVVTVQASTYLAVNIYFTDTHVHSYASLNRPELRKLGARPGEI